jgi:mannose-6-phosphate isomerase-like protein (cupin superfamily)
MDASKSTAIDYQARDLSQQPVHLGLGASISAEPEFTGIDWYAGYGKRHEADGREGRLVSMFTFDCNWDTWEMHPAGAELVLVTQGALTLIQETAAGERRIELTSGQYAINPPGVWHTADAKGEVTAIFITSGLGTEHRAR